MVREGLWEGASHAEGRASYAEERARTVAQSITWEVLGGSSAGRDMVIIANNTEPSLFAHTLNIIHPSLHLILPVTLLPPPWYQKAVAEALYPRSGQSSKEPGVTPRQPGLQNLLT